MKKQLATFLLAYLRFFARLQLKKNRHARIIGITGTAGKSSTRNALYALLQDRFRVKVSFGANSESGIPLDILGLKMRGYTPLDWLRVLILAPIHFFGFFESFDVYIVEMGIDSPFPPKNMSYLLSIVQPQIGIVLNAGSGHSFAFDSLIKSQDPKTRVEEATRLIAEEKMKLLFSLPKDGLAIFNDQDKNLQALSKRLSCRRAAFGKSEVNECQILGQQIHFDEQQVTSQFRFAFHNRFGSFPHFLPKESQAFRVQFSQLVLADHYAESFAAAFLVAKELGLKNTEIVTALEKHFQLPPGRASLIAGKNHSWILDSSYNASSMFSMVELAKELPLKKTARRYALLGDMREFGEETEWFHKKLARIANEGFDLIVLVGPAMAKYCYPILRKKSATEIILASDCFAAAEEFQHILQKDDLLLVKGSQNTLFLEEAVKILMDKPKQAKQLLCRQDNFWLQQKTQFFHRRIR